MASPALEPRVIGEFTPQQTRWQTCPPRCLSGLGTNPQLPARALRPVSSPTELLPHAHLPSQVVRRARLHATLATPSQGPDPAAPVLSRTRPLALPTRALPRHPRAMTGVTETFTASTAALLGGPLARARAPHATPDTVVRAVRPSLPLPRLPQRTMQKLRYHRRSRHHRHLQDRLLAFRMFALIRRHRLATRARYCLRLCF